MLSKIRKAHLSDLPYMYEICRKTGLNGKDSSNLLSDQYLIGQYFAAPYFHYEIDTCFILEINAIPMGYIIGASSTEKFNDWMNKKWLPIIRAYHPVTKNSKKKFEKKLIDTINKECSIPNFLVDYPSHLHINLLPEAQKMGFGKKLISIFIDNLISNDSTGLHLATGLENTNAIEFYKNIGFKKLKKDPETLFMGLNFDEKMR